MGRGLVMKHHEFTLRFGIRAKDEADAWVQLGDLLESLTRGQLIEAMHLERSSDLTGRDAVRAFQVLGHLVKAVDECGESIMTAQLNDAIMQASDLLRETEIRTARDD
jgi:hypothetical protein